MTPVKFPYHEFDASDVRTYPLASRPSKVSHREFGRAWDPSTGFDGWLGSLPHLLAAGDLRAVASAIGAARAADAGLSGGSVRT